MGQQGAVEEPLLLLRAPEELLSVPLPGNPEEDEEDEEEPLPPLALTPLDEEEESLTEDEEPEPEPEVEPPEEELPPSGPGGPGGMVPVRWMVSSTACWMVSRGKGNLRIKPGWIGRRTRPSPRGFLPGLTEGTSDSIHFARR